MTRYHHLARYFLARSDVEAAVRLLSPGDPLLSLYARKHWPQFFGPERYKNIYDVAGQIEAQVDGVFEVIPHQARYQMIASFWARLHRELHNVVDFGCSRAAHAIHLHNAFGTKFTCIDIDKKSIEEAEKFADRYAKDRSAFTFAVGDETLTVPNNFDGAMLLEVVEHVTDAQVLLDTAETWVRPGGWIILSVPHGPVEYTMWKEQPHRNREHVRELGLDDLYDMLSHKKDFMLLFMVTGKNRYLDMAEGTFVVAYRTGMQPVQSINWERKLSLGGVPDVELPGE